MALPHAQLLETINVSPLGPKLVDSFSTSLIKTEHVQLLHLVLAAREDQPDRHVDQECVIHCLEGQVEVVTPGGTRSLGQGQLVVLPARQKHHLRARTDCAVLMTLLLDNGDAAHGGGSGARTLQDEPGSPRNS
ncbi:cupin domain-containing protein [Ramlibacter rhizophilus]|uniref:Cupin domain-containing protein n=1 Tax=Ramlibacter rhizophilus TaxID=1781167 RepID=A0A4Z0BJK1_9BURK|nr:cupin domain-containing protein [Ramlibacter rhizophilus]TFY99495.1 cupin domain-containing protein [Ramlibacter rhizophilus]